MYGRYPVPSREALGSLSVDLRCSPIASFASGTIAPLAPAKGVRNKGRSAARSERVYRPACTVVVCTRNRPELLNQCLAAVSKLEYGKFDILVVDNGSGDERTREVAAFWGAGYVLEPAVGASRARNRGARMSQAEIVAYLDDDAIPEAGWLSGLALEFRDPRVMAATGQIRTLSVARDGEEIHASVGDFERGHERLIVDLQEKHWFELSNFGGLGDGNMAFRRRAFECWPGFHLSLGPGTPLNFCEEHHAFFSLIDKGYRVVYTPDAIVHHSSVLRTLPELQTRRLAQLSASTAYAMLMLVEQPAYRWATLKYFLQAIAGRRRRWRCPPSEPVPPVSPLKILRALLAGPFLYAQARLRNRESAAAAVVSAEAPSASDRS
jgi:cellulose synthase/poly-beta-1,6-N-acetylglucosamine synthase-like glycosyltransferase